MNTHRKRCVPNIIGDESRKCIGVLKASFRKGRVSAYLSFNVVLAFTVLCKEKLSRFPESLEERLLTLEKKILRGLICRFIR